MTLAEFTRSVIDEFHKARSVNGIETSMRVDGHQGLLTVTADLDGGERLSLSVTGGELLKCGVADEMIKRKVREAA